MGGGGRWESDHPAFGPPASISLHLISSFITPAGSVHKSRGDSVVRIWVQLMKWCVSCVWVLQRGNSGDVCDLASTLCKYDLRKGDLSSGKSLQLLCIFPFCMVCLSAISMMFVKIMLAVCILVGMVV